MLCWRILRTWLSARSIECAGLPSSPITLGSLPFVLDAPPFDFAAVG